MAKMLDTVHTHTHYNLVNKNINTQYICVFNNDINKTVGAGLVPAHNG